jgi:ATP-dependent helicase HepA
VPDGLERRSFRVLREICRVFVKAISGEAADWGLGKLVGRNGPLCEVEYFDAPMAEPTTRQCLASELGSVSLPAQTRAYAFDTVTGAWEIGRILDDHGETQLVKFPNGKTLHLPITRVFVRWDRSIEDPTSFLGAGISETPRFADGRGPFVRTLLQQRSSALGMSALSSSAIDLEAHQIEVVRKVLQDPVQRYLLADEVGLGKTIEAGVLIRQCMLDDPQAASVLVVVPDTLVSQWRLELSTKFFLGDLLDEKIFVEALSAKDRIASRLSNVTMLVIDEAHHVTAETAVGARLYELLVAAAPAIERVLLLSATPALHNERGFLRMLHLLDPQGYPLDSEDAFRQRVESRQALAEIVASLAPENALYLDYTLDQLAELFPEDQRLQGEAALLRQVLIGMPPEDSPELIEAIARVRDHLSEVYRLHRRILRHRRRSVVGLTPDRSGLETIRYRSTSAAKAAELAEDWRFAEASHQGTGGLDQNSLSAAFELAERRATYVSGEAVPTKTPGGFAGLAEPQIYGLAETALSDPQRGKDRLEALVAAIASRLSPKVQFIIFCSEPEAGDLIAAALFERLKIPVDRHDPYSEAWRSFGDDPSRQVLVCDRRAEEGLNLQGGEKVVVHYDLPWNPNRIEQRLGRADRYGSGHAIKSLALCCDDDALEGAWTRYLDEGLRVFDRSIASLQYFIEKTVKGLPNLLLLEGLEGIDDLTERDGGAGGRIEREIKEIDDQDALDALGAPPSETLDALSEVDDEWREIEANVTGWIQATLQFERSQEPTSGSSGAAAATGLGGIFRYRYLTGDRHTLIPLQTFVEHCRPAIDVNLRVARSRDVWTKPCTYRRHSALSRQGRAVGARILRYGDPLLAGLWDITQRDERGRSTAVWRHVPGKAGDTALHFRFDFVVEADVRGATDVLDLAGNLTSSALSSLGRRGDMALPPLFHTVWLDADLQLVADETVLAALAKPYSMEASEQGGRDFNLNSKRLRILRDMHQPYLEDWGEVCRRARARAEECLKALPALNDGLDLAARRAEAMDAGRLGLLQARALRPGADSSTDLRELDLERALSEQLIAGIRAPRISLDAVCAIFLAADPAVAAALARA